MNDGLVLFIPIESAVACGNHGHIFNGGKHEKCPGCGDGSKAPVRIGTGGSAAGNGFELFLLRDLPPKEESGPHVVSAMAAAVLGEMNEVKRMTKG